MAARSQRHLRCPDAHSLAQALAHLCQRPETCTDGWIACCPSHDDNTPSLHITPADDKVLLHCFAGCASTAIMAALGLSEADLFVQHHDEPTQRITAIYNYTDVEGTLVHQTVRFEPKKFSQRRPDPDKAGAFVWNLKTIEPVLYHLPDVIEAIAVQQPIYLVEGEKDADLLHSKGLIATCNPMGAGKWRSSYTETLRGANVVILADHDTTGHRHAEEVAQALLGVARTIKVIDALHTDKPGSDVSDWLAAGGTREEFEAFVETAPLYEVGPNQAPPGFAHYGTQASFPPSQAPSSSGTRRDPEEETAWYAEEVEPFRNKKGIVEANDTTICAFLRNHSYWQGKLWWDDMANKPMWEEEELSDYRITKIGADFGKKHLLPIRTDRILARCLTMSCYEHRRDPLQDYLETIPGWDGVERLEDWLLTCAGIANTAYNRFVSRILPVSMIARAYEPGCLYRNVIVFEGPEEFRKSSLVAALVPNKRWHLSMTSSFENKDVPMLIQGIWIAELSELDSLTRTEETRLKSFISETEDAYVPKWQLFRIAPKRRTIFVGTTNESNWLKSQTGNTRFWPVRIFHPMDIEYFEHIREQLYAEAKLWYYDHQHNWWSIPAEVQGQATLEREERRQGSIYEDPLREWLMTGRFTLAQQSSLITPVAGETSFEEIYLGFLNAQDREKWNNQGTQKQIAQALKALGWRQKVVKRHGKSVRIWCEDVPLPF